MKLTTEQKLSQIMAILFGVVDEVTPNQQALEAIKKIVNK